VIVSIVFIPIFCIFLLSGKILLLFGQDPIVSHQAYLYILSYSPGIYLMALFDLQRRFLISTGNSKVQMQVQVCCSLTHVLWNYILVVVFDLGVVGTGLSSIITNSLILSGNLYASRRIPEL
jgi:Na+-driven multidrug efflux pump